MVLRDIQVPFLKNKKKTLTESFNNFKIFLENVLGWRIINYNTVIILVLFQMCAGVNELKINYWWLYQAEFKTTLQQWVPACIPEIFVTQ